MIELVRTITEEICDNKNKVEVTEIPATSCSIIEVKVSPEDYGKMIGKKGKTAEAIRTIMYAVSHRYSKRYNLEIIKNTK